MDGHHEPQDKDFLASMFPNDNQQNMFSMPYTQQQQIQQPSIPPPLSPTLNVDMLNNLISMQGIDSQQPASPTSPSYNAQNLLEQQFKLSQLQQLQQLQNQIFQQQIALISGQASNVMQSPSSSLEPRRELQNQFNGLPTPGPSAEIHAQQPSMDFVSPIVLSNSFIEPTSHPPSLPPPQEPFRPDLHMAPIHPPNHHMNHNFHERGSTSAPAHIAFRNSISSSADLDFDISPLTSPWLGAQQHHHPGAISRYPTANKRSASSSGDETNGMPSRKKHSPAIRPTNPGMPTNGSRFRATRSTNSTPLIRSTRSRKGSIAGGEVPADSPSPVDLSMPPPAPPIGSSASSSGSEAPPDHFNSSPQFNPHLTPVTPASIMKLGRLGINNSLVPPTTRQIIPLKTETKGKAAASAAKPKAPVKNTRKAASLVSPSLKPILPAGSAPIPIAPPVTAPVVQVRKTSHKAAEQKRRDSLKTTFDDLRVLLPPIPLPTDEKYPPEEILPGALPPRGPPKAGGEGPNKGVSKLQLLMCGNEYIRVLKSRVNRRDSEIEKLRSMVRRMSLGAPPTENDEDLDLDRDLDSVELLGGGILGLGGGVTGMGGAMATIGEDAFEGGDDDD
ncbi:hypothetical protein H0H93_004349 [Arthromyces matolae]|nr:hypothetical protein H0H93_004349 [Arthromyces matolae]